MTERARVVVVDVDELEAIVEAAVRRALEAIRVEGAGERPCEWLDRDGAAELLGVHRDTVRKLEGVPVHRVGRRLRYRRDEIEKWIRNGRGPA